MKSLDEKFNSLIMKNKDSIEDYIYDIICDELLCPNNEGVPCTDCMKYVLEIMLKI